MQIVTMMGQVIESGKVTLSTKNKESIEIIAVNKKIDVNLKDKDLNQSANITYSFFIFDLEKQFG